MAKSAFPMPKVGHGKKFFLLVSVVVLIAFVIRDPHGTAQFFQHVVSGVGSAFDALMTFFQAL